VTSEACVPAALHLGGRSDGLIALPSQIWGSFPTPDREETAVSTTKNRAAANLAVVGGVYEAFGRGDVDFILGQIADDCEWESWLDNHGQTAGVPPIKPRYGRAGVAEFFAYVATMQTRDFRVLDMLASDRQVVVEVQISIAMPDGGSVTEEELHLYSLNDEAGSIACATTSTPRSESRPTVSGSGAGPRP